MDTQATTQTSFSRSVGRNTLIQFFGKIVGTVLGLGTSVIILRYLHPDGNGAYTTAMAYAGFFSVVADLGLYLILVRDMNKPGADVDRIVGNLLALRWASALVILGTGAALVSLMQFTGQEKIAVIIASSSFIAVAATQLLVGIFQSRLAMLSVTMAEIVGRCILFGCTWWVAHMHGSLYGVMFAVVFGAIANFFIVYFSARRFVRLRLRFDWPYWSATLKDTFPIALSIVLNLIYFRADTIILRLYHGTYDVGLYGAAYKVLEVLNTFPIMFVGLLLPALGAAYAAHNIERFRLIFQRGFELLLMAILPLLVGGWFLAKPILVLIGGTDYAPAAPVLTLLLVAVGALFLNSLSGHTVTIIHRQRQMVWTYLGVAVVGLTLYFSLIPRFSYYGAAIGTITTESLTAIVGYIVVTKAVGFRLRFGIVPKLLLAIATMIGAFLLTSTFSPWVGGIIAVLLYSIVVLVTRAVHPSTLRELFSRTPSSVSPLSDQ